MVPRAILNDYRAADAPQVISDIMPETKHMVTGRVHTSKSEFRKDTRATGGTEVGNEIAAATKERKPIELDRRQRRDDIGRAIYDLRNG